MSDRQEETSSRRESDVDTDTDTDTDVGAEIGPGVDAIPEVDAAASDDPDDEASAGDDPDTDVREDRPGGFDPRDAHAFTITAIGFELCLIPVAWLVLHFWDGPALEPPPLDPYALLLGVALTLPPVAALFAITWSPLRRLPPLRHIRERIESSFGKTLAELQLWQIVAISLAAGVGEEILFRGALQPRAGLIPAAVLFGLLHWISPTYAILAGLLGAYIGWSLQASENLLTPIIVHSLYDVVALVLVRRELQRSAVTAGDP